MIHPAGAESKSQHYTERGPDRRAAALQHIQKLFALDYDEQVQVSQTLPEVVEGEATE
jgi:hypothetical protein